MSEGWPTLVRRNNVFTPDDGHAVIERRSCSSVARVYVVVYVNLRALDAVAPWEKPEMHKTCPGGFDGWA